MSAHNFNFQFPETERITILEWFSTIPYQSHHDHACEHRVEHTGKWLFERKVFIDWHESQKSEILWIYGIRKLTFRLSLLHCVGA